MEFVSSHSGVYHLDVLGRLAPSLQARPPTPRLETPDRSVAALWLSCSELVCRQGHAGREQWDHTVLPATHTRDGQAELNLVAG